MQSLIEATNSDNGAKSQNVDLAKTFELNNEVAIDLRWNRKWELDLLLKLTCPCWLTNWVCLLGLQVLSLGLLLK
ncbi:hypothetical protein L1887_23781 [Cichorium endivia]|nr:hypothetical protein L1887_23781 [Cichorium endivia]